MDRLPVLITAAPRLQVDAVDITILEGLEQREVAHALMAPCRRPALTLTTHAACIYACMRSLQLPLFALLHFALQFDALDITIPGDSLVQREVARAMMTAA